MKVAKQNTPVYSRDGKHIIGELERGEKTLVLGETGSGTVVAYVLGVIKPEHEKRLVDEQDWHDEISEVDRFLAWIAAQIGCLYVWGAQGQKMTAALIKLRENSVRNYNRAMAQYNKHVKNGETLIAYDCSGLVVKYLMDRGLIGYDTTANGLYTTQCVAISESDLKAGDLVFKKSRTSSRIYHVGVYMGDGTVVHAKGRDDGVVRESFGKAGWNRFGRLKVMGEYDGDAVYTRLLKRQGSMMRGDDVRAVQVKLSESGFNPGGIDGVYGKNTEKAVKAYQSASGLEADGIVGPKTWESLIA